MNTAPTANAGSDQSVAENEIVQLTGAGTDADGDSLSYAWTQVSGPAGAFSAADTASTEFAVPTIAVGATEAIVLQLTVSDGRGGSATDDVTVSADSSDFLVFLRRVDGTSPAELIRYDPQTANESILNGSLVTNGRVWDFFLSPDQESVAYIADQETVNLRELYVAELDGSGIVKINTPFANAAGSVSTVKWSPDGSQIVYAADADLDEISEIYFADRDGGNHQKISDSTANGTVEFADPTWSPDGRYVFQIVRDPGTLFPLGINTHDTQAAGFNSTRITAVPATGTILSASWSADSTRVAFLSDSDTDDVFELYTVAPDGSSLQKISGPLVAGGDVASFTWAPDGSRLAYWGDQNVDEQADLFVVAPDGSGLTQINAPLPAGRTVSNAEWSSNSAQLAYRADDIEANNFRLFTAAADGSNAQSVGMTPIAGGTVNSFLWAPDGQRLAYNGRVEDAMVEEIFAVNADGTNAIKLSAPVAPLGTTFYSSVASFDAWSPDGTMFAYSINAFSADLLEVFVVSADGTGNTQVSRTPPANGGLQSPPAWSADGTALAYRSRQNDPATSELFIASPDGVANMAVTSADAATGFINKVRWVN